MRQKIQKLIRAVANLNAVRNAQWSWVVGTVIIAVLACAHFIWHVSTAEAVTLATIAIFAVWVAALGDIVRELRHQYGLILATILVLTGAAFLMTLPFLLVFLATGRPSFTPYTNANRWLSVVTELVNAIQSGFLFAVPVLLVACPEILRRRFKFEQASATTRRLLPTFLVTGALLATASYLFFQHFLGGPLKKIALGPLTVLILGVVALLAPGYKLLARAFWEYGSAKLFSPAFWYERWLAITAEIRASFTKEYTDQAARMRDQYAQLVTLQQRLSGPEHPDTLAARTSLASWTASAGDAAGARDQYAQLVALQQRLSGPEHPHTLAARTSLAYWTGQAGDAAAARDQYAQLVPLYTQVVGAEHPATLAVRAGLADRTGQAGDATGARDQYAPLVPLYTQVMGAQHPVTLAVRTGLAYWTGRAGDAAAARDQYAVLVPLYTQVIGAEHPDTLAVRASLAYWTGQADDQVAAREQYAQLIAIGERLMSSDDADPFATWASIAEWTGHAGDAAAARDEYARLVPALTESKGAKHPDTVAAQASLDYWTRQAGDAATRDQSNAEARNQGSDNTQRPTGGV